MTQSPLLLSMTVEMVAARLSCSVETAQQLIDSREIRGFRLGTEWRVEFTDLEAFVSEQRARADSEAPPLVHRPSSSVQAASLRQPAATRSTQGDLSAAQAKWGNRACLTTAYLFNVLVTLIDSPTTFLHLFIQAAAYTLPLAVPALLLERRAKEPSMWHAVTLCLSLLFAIGRWRMSLP